MPKDTLPALMVQQHDIVGLFLDIVHHYFRAPLAESLDDFRGLRPRTTVDGAAESGTSSSTGSIHFPRLAICDEDSGLLLRFGRLGILLSEN